MVIISMPASTCRSRIWSAVRCLSVISIDHFAQNVPHPLKNVSGLDYGVQLDWFASPRLTFHLNGSRILQDVVLAWRVCGGQQINQVQRRL